MNFKKLSLAFVTILWCLFLSGQANNTGILRAGFAKIDITPVKPVRLYGYSDRKGPSEGVHDPLSARAVAFENNGKKVVLISSDLGSYGGNVFTTIQKSILDKYNLKESELFLSAIHDHSSPILSLDKERGDPNNVEFTEELNKKLLTIVGEALNNLKPVLTGSGVGSSPVGVNRRETLPDGTVFLGRNPYGPTDKQVLVMKIATTDGTTIGTIFDYSTHATSLGSRNLLVSGDVLGISAQFVEKILGKNVVSPVFAGPSGDIDPWYRVLPGFETENGWIPETILMATMLGEEVVHVFRDIKEVNPGGEISTSFATIDCPRRKRPENRNPTGAGQPPAGAPQSTTGAPQPTSVPVNITAAHIGNDVAFIGIGVEMFNEIGKEIKAGSPYKYTFVITHCNGSSGYLPTFESYKEGGYEVNGTRFDVGSAEIVTKKALKMLYDLK